MRIRYLLTVVTMLLFTACGAFAEITTIYGSDTFGSVVVIEIPEQTELTVSLFLAVGAAEDGEQEGLAHFAEHRGFVGAQQAANYRGSINAFTTLRTTEFTTVATVRSLPDILTFYGYILENVSISEELFEIERSRIIREIDVAEGLAISRREICSAREDVFNTSPWKNCVLGNRSVIETLQANEVEQFQKQYYTRGNSVLVLSGPVSSEGVQNIIPRTGPAVWSGTPLHTPTFQVRQEYASGEHQGTALLAYRFIELANDIDPIVQSAALTYLAVWGLERFQNQLTETLLGDRHLVRNIDLVIEPIGIGAAMLTVFAELERGVQPNVAIGKINSAIEYMEPEKAELFQPRLISLETEASQPQIFQLLLAAELRNRRAPFDIIEYGQAIRSLRSEDMKNLYESLFDSTGWSFWTLKDFD